MSITKEEVAETVRQWCMAYQKKDIQTVLAMEARAVGFGFRALAWRDHARGDEAYTQEGIERFFSQKDYYSVELEDFETSVTGDIGLAWGTFVEKWQDKGLPPEQVRVRFSTVFAKGAQGWQVLLYHRDIQPFTDEGHYPKTLTVVSPDN